MLFQSTLSVRRATKPFFDIPIAHRISIHALRKESDGCHAHFLAENVISIHALRKESDLIHAVGQTCVVISIHALRKESDKKSITDTMPESISIHALRKESDGLASYAAQGDYQFQSTLSVRRATTRSSLVVSGNVISIHALRKESDNRQGKECSLLALFQSTLSVRRATCLTATGIPSGALFQSTLSVRRATQGRQRGQRHRRISIHALRKESDTDSLEPSPVQNNFNPRSP